MLHVALECPVSIAPSVFSNVYVRKYVDTKLITSNHKPKDRQYIHQKKKTINGPENTAQKIRN